MRTRNDKYKKVKKAKDGGSQSNIWPETNIFLDFYCKEQNINKTHYVNKAVMNQLRQDMKDIKVGSLMQDLFDLKYPEEQNTDKYEQIGIPGIE